MAKVSEVAICNYALSLLGEAPIISLQDNSAPAELCRSMYPVVRDAALEAHNWTFAVKWFDLPLATEPGLGYFQNRFPLPVDYLRVISVGNSPSRTTPYEIEGNAIVSNDAKCLTKMVVQITDTFKFSPMFVHALSAFLAAELAIPIASSAQLQQQMFQMYGVKLTEAVSRDQIQGTSKRITASWAMRGRVSGSRHLGAYTG